MSLTPGNGLYLAYKRHRKSADPEIEYKCRDYTRSSIGSIYTNTEPREHRQRFDHNYEQPDYATDALGGGVCSNLEHRSRINMADAVYRIWKWVRVSPLEVHISLTYLLPKDSSR